MKAKSDICTNCGAEVPFDAPKGFCPRCLYRLGFEAPANEESQPALGPKRPPDQPMARTFGDYELLEEIGHGGMGVVYMARQRSLGRMVALKLLPFGPHASPESVKRFRAEATATAALQHPNIVAIHQVGFCDSQHFIAMEYVEGQSLSALIRGNALPAQRATGYVKTIAEAIHHAHERGILHRDLKPANILIDRNDQPRVTDFGLARRLEGDSELTVTGQVLGSPNYMPPEQAAGKRAALSRRSDVYALGAVLYHALTGRPPFLGEAVAEIVQQVVNAEPISPRVLNPSVPLDLETVCLKCLEKEPARRYATAGMLAEELNRFLHGRPVLARPVSAAAKTWRWCRRNPQVASLATAGILVFVLGFAGVLWQWRRARAGELLASQRLYVSDINLAQQAVKENNPRRALELLNRHRPASAGSTLNALPSTDPCGFEWRYLWQQCQTEAEAVIGRFPDAIPCLQISPDGQWLMAGSEAGAVTLWNLSTGEQIPLAAAGGIRAMGAFSPDGQLVMFGDQTLQNFGSIGVWDLQARRRLPPIVDGRPIGPMSFSPDGKWFDYGVALLSPKNEFVGKAFVLLAFPSREKLREMAALTAIDSTAHGWDYEFTRDSRQIIFAETEDDRRIAFWDFIAGNQPLYFPAHRDNITALTLSPDGQTLATAAGYSEAGIKLWQVPSFRLLGELSGHEGWIRALKFSPDGRTLASAGTDQTIRLWDMPSRKAKRVFRGLRAEVSRLSFAPDGRKLFSGSGDGIIERWPIELDQAKVGTGFQITRTGLDPATVVSDGRVCAGLRDGAVFLGRSLDVARCSPLVELGTNNGCVQLSSDSRYLFCGTKGGEIQIWTIEQHRVLGRLRGPLEPVTGLRQDRSGHILMAMHRKTDGTLAPPIRTEVWNTISWERQSSRTLPASASGTCYEVSPDAQWLAEGDFRGPIRFWRLSGPPQELTVPSSGQTTSLAFSPDGKLLAAGTGEGRVTIWEMRHLRKLHEFQARAHPLFAVAFSPDSLRLATAGDGQHAIKLWTVDSWQELITVSRENETLFDLHFSAAGNQVVARNSQGDLLVWQVPSFAEIAAREKERNSAVNRP